MTHIHHKVISNVKEGTVEISNEIATKISGYMIGGLGVVAGLAWNDAIKAFIEYVFPAAKNTLVAQFVYAAIISLIVIVLSVFILKATKRVIIKKENQEIENNKTI